MKLSEVLIKVTDFENAEKRDYLFLSKYSPGVYLSKNGVDLKDRFMFKSDDVLVEYVYLYFLLNKELLHVNDGVVRTRRLRVSTAEDFLNIDIGNIPSLDKQKLLIDNIFPIYRKMKDIIRLSDYWSYKAFPKRRPHKLTDLCEIKDWFGFFHYFRNGIFSLPYDDYVRFINTDVKPNFVFYYLHWILSDRLKEFMKYDKPKPEDIMIPDFTKQDRSIRRLRKYFKHRATIKYNRILRKRALRNLMNLATQNI